MDRVEGDGLALFDYDMICGIVWIKWVIFFGSGIRDILRILFIGGVDGWSRWSLCFGLDLFFFGWTCAGVIDIIVAVEWTSTTACAMNFEGGSIVQYLGCCTVVPIMGCYPLDNSSNSCQEICWCSECMCCWIGTGLDITIVSTAYWGTNMAFWAPSIPYWAVVSHVVAGLSVPQVLPMKGDCEDACQNCFLHFVKLLCLKISKILHIKPKKSSHIKSLQTKVIIPSLTTFPTYHSITLVHFTCYK